MTVRMRLVGLADGRPTDNDGTWVVECDVDAFDGRGVVRTTLDPAAARTFGSVAEAHAYWQRTSTVAPVRPDGKPNRPLTAYTVEVAE